MCCALAITASSASTMTETITASSTRTIASTQALHTTETDATTVLHCFATTVTVNHSQDNVTVEGSSNFDGLQAAWMVAAIVFFVIAVSAIVLNIFLSYFLYRTRKGMDNSTTATSNPNTIELVTEGESEGIPVVDDA